MATRRRISRRDLFKTATAAGAGVAAGAFSSSPASAQVALLPTRWDREADVVIVGSGATGLPAAIVAREAGSSVIVLEAESDIGGHAICSGANIPLGGGTSIQKKAGIADSPDLVFRDLTDWSLTEPNGATDDRYNDREIIRAFADHCAETFEFLLAHGVTFVNDTPDGRAGSAHGNSVPRQMHVAVGDWPQVQTGRPVDSGARATASNGNGLMRPLEAAARKAGVNLLLEHRMTAIHREKPSAGRVLGVAVTTRGRALHIRARKAVIVATGGSSGNINFRRMFDPRLTEEYCGLAGMPWSNQDASGELAGMAVGASLWVRPIRPKTGNRYNTVNPYVPGSYRNAANVKFQPANLIPAALAGIGDGQNGGGPIWAIFDADAVTREKWNPSPPWVDLARGFFFRADTLADLAGAVRMRYQRVPMPPANLEETVRRYNGFVDRGKDEDFEKPTPAYKIVKPPFYAAWATPGIHDSRVGLRINANCQVVDMGGQVIPNLYRGGESAGGFSMHGLARCLCQGYIAGHRAHAERTS